jgi:hypothetical protein
VGTGYSGTGDGRNNPAMENVENVGPIPTGEYRIGAVHNHTQLGPTVMNLDPIGHNAQGRTAFRIHGDNIGNDASHGCVILNRDIRKRVAVSLDRILNVVSGTTP